MFFDVINNHLPLKNKRVKSSPAPWLSSEIKKEMLKRDSLLRLAVRTNVTSDWETYKIARNHVTGIIRDAKSNYYKHVINQNSNNSSKLWKTLKTVLPKKSSCTPSSIVYNDNVLISNNYFKWF